MNNNVFKMHKENTTHCVPIDLNKLISRRNKHSNGPNFRPRYSVPKKWVLVAALALVALTAFLWIRCAIASAAEPSQEAAQPYIFQNEVGDKISWQEVTKAWAAEAGYAKRYDLTDAERWEIASVVTAEAEGEPYAGKVAVAQCILQACEDDNIRPSEALIKYSYAGHRPEPCKDAFKAVQDVFDFGHVASTEPIKYFYAYKRTESKWHETQIYVMTINGHKFFKEAN